MVVADFFLSFLVAYFSLYNVVVVPSFVETTDFYGGGHAVETVDAAREAPLLISEDIP